MKGFKYSQILTFIFYVFLLKPSQAGIVVIPNMINFTAQDSPRSDVTIINEGEELNWLKRDLAKDGIQNFFKPFDENKMTARPVSRLITSRS